MTDQAAVDAAVAYAIDTAGRIDVLINNAGVGTFGVQEGFPVEQVQEIFDVNVFGSRGSIERPYHTCASEALGMSSVCRAAWDVSSFRSSTLTLERSSPSKEWRTLPPTSSRAPGSTRPS